MKIKYISKPVTFDSKPESYFVSGGSDDEFFIDEWFYDEDFVDEALKNFFEYNEKTKVVSFINKDGVTLKDLQEELSWCSDIEDKIEYDLEARIRKFKEVWMIDWIEEYFESDDGEVINPFEGDKREDTDLWD